MRQICKRGFGVFLSGVLLASSVSIVPVHALKNKRCEVFTTQSQRLIEALNTKEVALQTKRENISYKTQQLESTYKKKTTDRRANVDAARQKVVTQLLEKAETEAQKDAIAAYKTRIDAALLQYRTTSDTAHTTFTTQRAQLIESHRKAVSSAKAALSSQIAASANEQMTLCDTKDGTEKSQERFKNSLKIAEQRYKETPHISYKGLQTSLKAQREQYQATLKDARTALEKEYKSARADLKEVISQDRKHILE